jgi:hypothetical protein
MKRRNEAGRGRESPEKPFLLDQRLTRPGSGRTWADVSPGGGRVGRRRSDGACNQARRRPNAAFGAVRKMLRHSFETDLSNQLEAEKASIIAVSNTADAIGVALIGH